MMGASQSLNASGGQTCTHGGQGCFPLSPPSLPPFLPPKPSWFNVRSSTELKPTETSLKASILLNGFLNPAQEE